MTDSNENRIDNCVKEDMNFIPKIIHQIWIGPKKRPDIWMDTFKIDYIKKNPDYKYILWNEENIDPLFEDFPIYKQVYNLEDSYNGKSDILRYLILYVHGGIYVDADSVWVNDKSLDDLLEVVNESLVFVAKIPDYETITKKSKKFLNTITGGVMGSSKNNSLMKLLIEGIESYIIRKWQNNKIAHVDYNRKKKIHGPCQLIGPLYLNKILKDKNITIFPSKYFYPILWHGITDPQMHKKMDIPKESYMFQYGYTTNNFSF